MVSLSQRFSGFDSFDSSYNCTFCKTIKLKKLHFYTWNYARAKNKQEITIMSANIKSIVIFSITELNSPEKSIAVNNHCFLGEMFCS